MGKKRKPVRRPPIARAPARKAWRIPAWLWLVPIYLVAAGLHYEWLRKEAEFPLLATDEAQYLSIGENLRLGRGFTARGEFHAALPPLYPLFVAFAHSLGDNTRMSALRWSCLLICMVAFPAYGLARLAGLDRLPSYLLSGAAAMLPHTLWAGLYMTETLSYPLFLAAFWMFARWAESPTAARATIGGILLSALLLTKVAAWSFAAAIAATILILYFAQARTQGRKLYALRIFLPVAGSQLAWQAYKYWHGAAGFGMYGHVAASGLPRPPVALLVPYFADFLFGAGLVLAIPLVLWFLKNRRSRFPLAVLLGVTLCSQILVHGTLESIVAGSLKERLFLYSFPIIAIFGVAALRELASAGWTISILFVAVPLALFAVLLIYPFSYNPVLDIPWASALGSIKWGGVDTFTRQHLIRMTVALVVAAGILLMRLPVRWIPASLAGLLLVFNTVLFASSASHMTELSRRGLNDRSPMANWLKSAHLQPGDRLIVCGNMAFYQEQHRTTPMETFFVNWHYRFDLSDHDVFQGEILGRYDVRIARNPDQIRELIRPGDYLLTAMRMTGLDLVSFKYPFYLYTLKNARSAPVQALYAFDITAEQAYGWPLGAPAEQQTFTMLAQPVFLLPGRYRATMHIQADAAPTVTAEVVRKDNEALVASRRIDSPVSSFEFSTDGSVPLRLRLRGPGLPRGVFQEVRVEYLGGFVRPVAPGPDTGQILPEPARFHAKAGEVLPFSCDIVSVNEVEWAAFYSVPRGERVEFKWWINEAGRVPGSPWIEFVSDTGEIYYLEAQQSLPNKEDLQYIRGTASTAPLPVGNYRMTVLRADGNRRHGCLEYHRLTIADPAGQERH